jgi:hypothetical protein
MTGRFWLQSVGLMWNSGIALVTLGTLLVSLYFALLLKERVNKYGLVIFAACFGGIGVLLMYVAADIASKI